MSAALRLVLGIETSCDETGVAVVESGVRICSNVVASSQEFHRRFGGVVPEIAARKQAELISAVAQQALDSAGITWRDLDAVAVTHAPGLVGSLVVGVSFAKAAAFARALPLVAVHHIEGHIYSHFLGAGDSPPGSTPPFPFLALVVSGGHSDLIAVRGHGEYLLLGRTRDDAAGEAFDKGARLLGLGYPGGPALDAAACAGNPAALAFPRAVIEKSWDFSFSGVKTALARYLRETPPQARAPLEDLAASYQEAVVEVLVTRSIAAAQALGFQRLLVAGGVANNSRLRALMFERAGAAGIEVRFPPPELCTDNAAMVASAGYFRLQQGRVAGLDLDAFASAGIGQAS